MPSFFIKGVWLCIPLPFVLCCLDVEAKGGRNLSDVLSSELLEDGGLACIVQPPGEKKNSHKNYTKLLESDI